MLRNCPLIAGAPLRITTYSSQTSGDTATANAVQINAVTKRSTAARRPSTSRDQSGIATRKTTIAATTQVITPQPESRAGSPATASAITPTSRGAHRGSRAWEIVHRCGGHRFSLRSLRPATQRAAKLTRKVTTNSTRPVAISSDCRSGVASL